jgi:hypothetical protein
VKNMKRTFNLFLILVVLLTVIALPVLFIHFKIGYLQTHISNEPGKSHILGGFSIDNPERVTNSASDGVQVTFKYDNPPSESDPLGQKLQSLHMKAVDGYISSYLHYYECHRTKVLMPSLLGPGQYCQNDPYPYLTNENALLETIAIHLKEEQDNHLIIGYWVLDDWVQWDSGSARQLLIKIHHLIQQFTPGRSAICGFGGNLGINKGYGWDDWIADNFSPQGCDKLGFYIYAPSLPDTTPTAPPDAYDWTMSAVLPTMFASLQRRGWDITKEPLIGIAQAFGGPIANSDSYWITPTAKDIETQSKSFCEHGATGLAFYAWNDSGFGPTTNTPMNSPQIEKGIRNGITACKRYWSQHKQHEINSTKFEQVLLFIERLFRS